MIAVVVIVGALLFSTFYDEIEEWITGEDDERNLLADLPRWEAGYSWVYNESVEPGSGRVWTYIDYISGIESAGGKTTYLRSTLEGRNNSRFERLENNYHAINSLNVVDVNDGKPYFLDYDFPLKDGKQWSNTNTAEGFSGVYEVTFVKGIETDAGSYDCLMICGELVKYDNDVTTYQNRTFYYSPEVRKEVKSIISVEVYDGDDYNQWRIESELVAFGHMDSDRDFLADRVETEIMGTEPGNSDTDGDGVRDDHDLMPTVDMHLRFTLYEFETENNDEYDNGLEPSDCDPYLVVELRGAGGGQNDVFASYETEHFTDQNRLEDIEIVFDLEDAQEYEEYGDFEKFFYVDIRAFDDDSNDSTDRNGNDEVNINDDDSNHVCVNTMFVFRGDIKNIDDLEGVKEGETLYDAGSDSYQAGDDTKGGSISYTFRIIDGRGLDQ